MSVPVLELIDATVVKNDRRILDSLSLTIREGEHTAIIGPNGAGKSALLNLLTHEDRPIRHEDDSPSVRVFGEANWDVFALRTTLGIVSSDLHHRFVLGNNEGRVTGMAAVLSGFLATQGILRYSALTDEMRLAASEALARMGVSHLARRPLHMMSTGEARRVLLARALVTKYLDAAKDVSQHLVLLPDGLRFSPQGEGAPRPGSRPSPRFAAARLRWQLTSATLAP